MKILWKYILYISLLIPIPSYGTGVHIPVETTAKSNGIYKPTFKNKKTSKISNGLCINDKFYEDFKINAIRNEMMYASQLCHKQDDYNRVVSSDKNFWKAPLLSKWFRLHGGGNAYMRYTTELSNQQSMSSIHKFGNLYCDYHHDIFSYKKGDNSDKFINDQNIMVYTPYKSCNIKK